MVAYAEILSHPGVARAFRDHAYARLDDPALTDLVDCFSVIFDDAQKFTVIEDAVLVLHKMPAGCQQDGLFVQIFGALPIVKFLPEDNNE